MSTYELVGRTKQKQRTRAALVGAAQTLIRDGRTPTIDDAAETAGISRTTAYRYFPNQAALLAAAHPETIAESLLPPDAPNDTLRRVELVVDAFTAIIADSEAQQRTMLRLSLAADRADTELPLRQGRAIGWLSEALEPLRPRIGDDAVHRIALAIRSATGIEALVWLKDIGRLSTRDAIDIMRSNAAAICRAALDDAANGDP